MADLRRYQRAPVDCAVQFSVDAPRTTSEGVPGRAKDISLGGMYIQTQAPLPFGSAIVVTVTFPGAKSPVTIRGVVRWVRAGEGMGVQFGLLGARETHAITALTRAP